ncbi:MAG: hypothetical protein ACREOD_07670 [Candidatus Dormibacteria bacterium]
MASSRAASALLASLLALAAVGCGASRPQTDGGRSCGAGHRVEVVVELGDHHAVDSCVSFHAARISGEAALRHSGIEFATQQFSFGLAVCQIDHDPRSYSQCLASGQPYWALFIWSGHGPWRSASTGISGVSLRPGQALGWRYVPSSGSAPPPRRPPGA